MKSKEDKLAEIKKQIDVIAKAPDVSTKDKMLVQVLLEILELLK